MTQTVEVANLNVPDVEPAGFGGQSVEGDASELSDVERLETLLLARTRSHGNMQRELERKDRLLREALLRISTSTSQEFSALRAGYDAAVARAIEAEVAKAELTFALDETRAQLTAAVVEVDIGAGVGVPSRAVSVYVNGVDHASSVQPAAVSSELTTLRAVSETLRGELNGLRARVAEAETAWQAAYALSQTLNLRVGTAQSRIDIDGLRAETAELTLLAQTRAASIAELTQAIGLDQQEIRALRAQVATTNAAQIAQNDAREADRQLWSERFSQYEEREQAAWKAAAEAVARSESRLREFLTSLEQPLKELDSALDVLNPTVVEPQPQRAPKKSALRASNSARASARGTQSEEPASSAHAAQRLKNSSAEE